jgi:NAD-dependent deacetylase
VYIYEVMKEKIRQVAEWIIGAKSVVVFIGAGMSTESGIPDFRSPGGIWEKYDPEDFSFDKFLASEESREKYWEMSTETYNSMKNAQPNAGHFAVAELEKLGKLGCLITQNIDGLHFRAGNSEKRTIELHGAARYVTCLLCGKRYNRDAIQDRVGKGEKVPRCTCNGLLKPSTVSFGQSMPEKETVEAYRQSEGCDVFIVIGSSLVVQPAGYMPVMAKMHGARLVIVNRDETACDELADVVINAKAGSTMAAIVEEVKKRI